MKLNNSMLSVLSALLLTNFTASEANASSYGRVQVDNTTKPTYVCIIDNPTLASNPTDIITIQGSSTKTVKIQEINVYWATSSGLSGWQLYGIRRQAANSGGTSTAPSLLRLNRNDSSATTVVNIYSANPTTLGSPSDGKLFGAAAGPTIDAAGALSGLTKQSLYTATSMREPITLNGTSDYLCINANSVGRPNTTTSFGFEIILTEE